jgi:DNA-binding transcriptional regulator YiaG
MDSFVVAVGGRLRQAATTASGIAEGAADRIRRQRSAASGPEGIVRKDRAFLVRTMQFYESSASFPALMAQELRNIREAEGLSRAELSRLAQVSEATIQRAEKGMNVSRLTMNRLLNAFNSRPGRQRAYRLADLFPDGENG